MRVRKHEQELHEWTVRSEPSEDGLYLRATCSKQPYSTQESPTYILWNVYGSTMKLKLLLWLLPLNNIMWPLCSYVVQILIDEFLEWSCLYFAAVYIYAQARTQLRRNLGSSFFGNDDGTLFCPHARLSGGLLVYNASPPSLNMSWVCVCVCAPSVCSNKWYVERWRLS